MKPVDILMLASMFGNAPSQWLHAGRVSVILVTLSPEERDIVVAALKALDADIVASAPQKAEP